jgi:plastocyanin
MRFMGRGMAVALAALGVLASWAPTASAAPTQIEFGGNSFTPNDVTVDFAPDENTFEWNRNEPVAKTYHSITAKGGSFGIGPGDFTDFDLRASAGTYPYYCINHGAGGNGPMAGQVAVRPTMGEKTTDGFDVIWADGDTETGSSFATRWKRPGRPGWKSWQPSTEATHREFGLNDKPVDVKPGKIYWIRVRSSGPGSSKWSPTLSARSATAP